MKGDSAGLITIFTAVVLEDGLLEVLRELGESQSVFATHNSEKSGCTGMKAQHASLVTRVPSEQTADSAVGAARVRAARATKARREPRAIAKSQSRVNQKDARELVVLRTQPTSTPGLYTSQGHAY